MRLWLLISSLCVFLAGGAAGFLGARMCGSKGGERPRGFFGPGFDPELSPFTSEQVYKDIGLDDAQRQKIDGLFADHQKRVSEMRKAMGDLSRELREGIYAVLSPEQKDRFEKVREEYATREMESQASQEVLALKRDIPLTDVEEAQVRPLLLAANKERRALMASPPSDRAKWMEQWQEIRTRRDEAIRKVLSAEKFQKYKEIKEKSRRGPGPGPDFFRQQKGERHERERER